MVYHSSLPLLENKGTKSFIWRLVLPYIMEDFKIKKNKKQKNNLKCARQNKEPQ